MPEKQRVEDFGLIIIGNEILDGRRQDRHFANTSRLLRERRLRLAYVLMLPDEESIIEAHLRWAMARPEPFFCCGGIGSTPDDLTRDVAARAAGVPVELHPEGAAILQERFGAETTPARLKMVEFPAGSMLIPNPINRVPGFHIANGFFVPGFPEMAEPMMAWVLDTHFDRGPERVARSLVLPGAREADLVMLMETFVATHRDVSFSSLPRFTEQGTEVQLGLSGPPKAVDAGMKDMREALRHAGVPFVAGESGPSSAPQAHGT